jgi:hypothetical protein
MYAVVGFRELISLSYLSLGSFSSSVDMDKALFRFRLIFENITILRKIFDGTR